MPVNLRQARQLCTKPELELVLASGGPALQSMSEARLKLKVVRARALRDKYRDLVRRQRVAARVPGAKTARADASARTAAKAELFDQVLARFADRLARVQGKAAPQARGAAVSQAKQRPDGVKAAKAASKVATQAKRKAATTKAASRSAAASRRAADPPSATAAAAPAGPRPDRSPKAPAAVTQSAPQVPPARGFVSEKAAQLARNVKLRSMQARAVQAHVSSRGRRNQAKRDSRSR
jgi:hypothetical protein